MSFNPDPRKQAQKVIFSRERHNLNHDSVFFNNNFVEQVPSQKHFGMHLDTKLNFQEHLGNIMSKVDKTIGLLRKRHVVLPCPSLATIIKQHLYNLTLIMGILYKTKHTKKHFIKN